MNGRPTWTDCDKAGDYVVHNVLSPRDLVSRPDNMVETVPLLKHSLCVLVRIASTCSIKLNLEQNKNKNITKSKKECKVQELSYQNPNPALKTKTRNN